MQNSDPIFCIKPPKLDRDYRSGSNFGGFIKTAIKLVSYNLLKRVLINNRDPICEVVPNLRLHSFALPSPSPPAAAAAAATAAWPPRLLLVFYHHPSWIYTVVLLLLRLSIFFVYLIVRLQPYPAVTCCDATNSFPVRMLPMAYRRLTFAAGVPADGCVPGVPPPTIRAYSV
jgi:hypothetical protein